MQTREAKPINEAYNNERRPRLYSNYLCCLNRGVNETTTQQKKGGIWLREKYWSVLCSGRTANWICNLLLVWKQKKICAYLLAMCKFCDSVWLENQDV